MKWIACCFVVLSVVARADTRDSNWSTRLREGRLVAIARSWGSRADAPRPNYELQVRKRGQVSYLFAASSASFSDRSLRSRLEDQLSIDEIVIALGSQSVNGYKVIHWRNAQPVSEFLEESPVVLGSPVSEALAAEVSATLKQTLPGDTGVWLPELPVIFEIRPGEWVGVSLIHKLVHQPCLGCHSSYEFEDEVFLF